MKQLIYITLSLALMATNLYSQEVRTHPESYKLIVHVQNIKSETGQIKVGVYNDENTWLAKSVMRKSGDIVNGKTTIVFEDVKNGNYGISLYHDKNDNGKLDTGLFGIPKEPYACSNGAKGRFGPPKWKDAVFTISGDHAEHIIKL